MFNSLAPGGFENIFQNVFFKLISWIDTLSNSCETVLRRMPQNPSDDKSTLVQVMAWCRQATSHYLSQCCLRSLSPYGVTRPQWVKTKWANVRYPVRAATFWTETKYTCVCVLHMVRCQYKTGANTIADRDRLTNIVSYKVRRAMNPNATCFWMDLYSVIWRITANSQKTWDISLLQSNRSDI